MSKHWTRFVLGLVTVMIAAAAPAIQTRAAQGTPEQSTPGQGPLEQGLIGRWQFKNCSPVDSSKIAHVSRRREDVPCEPGPADQAARFRGTKHMDHLEVDNVPPIQLTRAFTINLWFRIESDTSLDPNHFDTQYGTQVLLAKSDDRSGLSIRLERSRVDGLWYPYVLNGRCCETTPVDSLRVLLRQGGVPLREWHMITLVHKPEQDLLELYLDGALKSSVKAKSFDLNPKTDTEPLFIGAERRGIWYPFDGLIDEVRIYDRPLSNTEVNHLFFE
jgi:Concanavalin A-like lectin/glucanases superfamily